MLGGLVARPFGTSISQDATRYRRTLRDMQRVIRQVHDIIHYAGEITFVQRITLRTVALKTRYAQVLKGITLDLIMNMKTTLLGASRSGKTTLFGCFIHELPQPQYSNTPAVCSYRKNTVTYADRECCLPPRSAEHNERDFLSALRLLLEIHDRHIANSTSSVAAPSICFRPRFST